jgi:hypothetical protein
MDDFAVLTPSASMQNFGYWGEEVDAYQATLLNLLATSDAERPSSESLALPMESVGSSTGSAGYVSAGLVPGTAEQTAFLQTVQMNFHQQLGNDPFLLGLSLPIE